MMSTHQDAGTRFRCVDGFLDREEVSTPSGVNDEIVFLGPDNHQRFLLEGAPEQTAPKRPRCLSVNGLPCTFPSSRILHALAFVREACLPCTTARFLFRSGGALAVSTISSSARHPPARGSRSTRRGVGSPARGARASGRGAPSPPGSAWVGQHR